MVCGSCALLAFPEGLASHARDDNTNTHQMKTLLQQYTAQASNDANFRTLDSMEEEFESKLDTLDSSLSDEYKDIMAQLIEAGDYRQSVNEYIVKVNQLANASKEASPSDWSNPEQTAIGCASDNSRAGDSIEANLDFIATLDYYIDSGIDCEKDLDAGCQHHAVNLPTFKG